MTTHKIKVEWLGQRHTTRLQTEEGEVVLFRGVPTEVLLTLEQIEQLTQSGNFRVHDADLIEEEKVPPKTKVRKAKISIRDGKIVRG